MCLRRYARIGRFESSEEADGRERKKSVATTRRRQMRLQLFFVLCQSSKYSLAWACVESG